MGLRHQTMGWGWGWDWGPWEPFFHVALTSSGVQGVAEWGLQAGFNPGYVIFSNFGHSMHKHGLPSPKKSEALAPEALTLLAATGRPGVSVPPHA